jgi:flagellin
MFKLMGYINGLNMGVAASLNTSATATNPIGTLMTFTSTTPPTAGMSVTGSALVDMSESKDSMVTVTTDTPSVDSSAYYKVGITGVVLDSTTGGGTANTAMSMNSDGSTGIATTSYTDGAGENLSSTDLSTQAYAQIALTALNRAITDVAALDGYIGGQINMLNSVSQVISTQQQNVVAAQNAIQATDYASATSQMSKYEILSQTGIAALAQANSVQQEVTKLLQ